MPELGLCMTTITRSSMDLYSVESTKRVIFAQIRDAIQRSYEEPTLVDRLEEIMRN